MRAHRILLDALDSSRATDAHADRDEGPGKSPLDPPDRPALDPATAQLQTHASPVVTSARESARILTLTRDSGLIHDPIPTRGGEQTEMMPASTARAPGEAADPSGAAALCPRLRVVPPPVPGEMRSAVVELRNREILDYDLPRTLAVEEWRQSLPGGASAEMERLIVQMGEIKAHCLARTTRDSYAAATLGALNFAEANHLPSILPLPIPVVALWLTDMFNSCSAQTVKNRLSGLNKTYAYHGLDPPGHDPQIRQLVRGMAKLQADRGAPRQKDPVTKEILARLVAVIATADEAARQEDVLLILLNRRGLPWVSLAGLQLEGLAIGDAGMHLRPGGAGGGHPLSGEPIWIPRGEDFTCPVRTAELLLAVRPGGGAMFTGYRDGKPIQSPQGIGRRLARIVSRLGVGDRALPLSSWPEKDFHELVRRCRRPSLEASRDTALFTALFASSKRRQMVPRFLWGNVEVHGDEVHLQTGREKTNQAGKPGVIVLPISDRPLSPGAALLRWKERFGDEIGGDPIKIAPSCPIFPTLHSSQTLKVHDASEMLPLYGEAVNKSVRRWARAAEFTGDFSSHSFRAGLVTSAVDAGAHPADICKVAGWSSVAMLDRYNRGSDGARRVLKAIGV